MSVGEIVKLDVGGTIFKTSESTLTKLSGFFRSLLETGIPPTVDESGAIFIDRDAAHFRLILNFMRDEDIKLPESLDDVEEIQKEAQYYQLDGLWDLCEERVSRKLNFIKTSNELLQLIASIRNRPLVVINCATDKYGNLIGFPEGFKCLRFVREFQDRYDIYFRTTPQEGWEMQAFDETQECVLAERLEHMDDCNWRLRNNLAPIPVELRRPDRYHDI